MVSGITKLRNSYLANADIPASAHLVEPSRSDRDSVFDT